MSTARELNRRQFLAQGGATAAALLAARGLAAEAVPPKGPAVLIVRDKTKKVIDGFNVDAAIAQKLVDKAVMTLTGKDDIAKAWATYAGPKDKVAIKFNGLFRRATTHPELIVAVANGLVKAGVDPANIVVYDRSDKDLKTADLTLNRDGKGIRIYGTERDYGSEVKAGPVSTKISKILLDATVLINLPILKSHVRCSITGALKNHLGTVPNAGGFHNDCCAAIADLNTLAPIKEKTRLCIADAFYAQYDGGPTYSAGARWDFCGVLASTDPVALDATFDDIIMARRVEKGIKPRHNEPTHILRAAELGLGEANIKNIKRLEIEV